jgi:hypothetical protein
MNTAASERAELIKWWDVVDLILGAPFVASNIDAGVRFARECTHEDARWLAALFPDGPVVERDVFLETLRALPDDRRALFFVASVVFSASVGDFAMLQRAAEMDYAPAQAALAEARALFSPQQCLDWAERSAAQQCRSGMYALARMCASTNLARSKQLMREAALLGCVGAMWAYAAIVPTDDPEQFEFLARAAAHGVQMAGRKLSHAATRLSRQVRFDVGRACVINAEEGRAQGFVAIEQEFGALKAAVKFYVDCNAAARAAIECWIAVARRLGVMRDIRGIIARMLWKQRIHWSSSL